MELGGGVRGELPTENALQKPWNGAGMREQRCLEHSSWLPQAQLRLPPNLAFVGVLVVLVVFFFIWASLTGAAVERQRS